MSRHRVVLRSIALSVVLLAPVAGCDGPAQTTSGPAGQSMLSGAITDYHAHRYAEARKQAGQVMQSTTGHEREQAAYIAGLSAYQQGELSEAERCLQAAAASGNLRTAGRAKAMLGMIRMKQNRPREAAELFRTAAGALDGEDARNAAHQAGLAYRQAGDDFAARTWFAMATRRGAETAPVSSVPAAMSSSNSGRPNTAGSALPTSTDRGFTLQVGAYQQRELADRAAAEAQKVASASGLGPVRIVTSQDERGRVLHLVQLGRFETRATAADIRQRIGKLQYIVAPYSSAATR